ncbi:hypothetical protein [Chryseobacterium flavum]|uniref:hypothetical protein n=1 Tax=Chryseobacterium flavum TaxID=415851 RepID=UPI0028B1E137|nr:hypothetical protein [Chryseobacterium flavum]
MAYNNEKEIAIRAEQMLGTALRAKTSSFADHVNRIEGDPSIKEAVVKSTVKPYGKVRNGTKKYYFRKLAIKMARHGFIQNAGINTIRSGGTRTRHNPQETTYGFKSHVMKMPAHPFIEEAIESSGVKEFVTSEVTRLRSEEIVLNIRNIVESIRR